VLEKWLETAGAGRLLEMGFEESAGGSCRMVLDRVQASHARSRIQLVEIPAEPRGSAKSGLGHSYRSYVLGPDRRYTVRCSDGLVHHVWGGIRRAAEEPCPDIQEIERENSRRRNRGNQLRNRWRESRELRAWRAESSVTTKVLGMRFNDDYESSQTAKILFIQWTWRTLLKLRLSRSRI